MLLGPLLDHYSFISEFQLVLLGFQCLKFEYLLVVLVGTNELHTLDAPAAHEFLEFFLIVELHFNFKFSKFYRRRYVKIIEFKKLSN